MAGHGYILCSSSDDAYSPILDTSGNALQRGVEYYILLAASSNSSGGGLTLIDWRSCLWIAGQTDLASSNGSAARFSPLFEEETIIRESRDFIVKFSSTTFYFDDSTTWEVWKIRAGKERKLMIVATGRGEYFRIERNNINGDGGYYLAWCDPTAHVCPVCRTIGIVLQDGKRLLALDGPELLSVVFKKATCRFC